MEVDRETLKDEETTVDIESEIPVYRKSRKLICLRWQLRKRIQPDQRSSYTSRDKREHRTASAY